MFDRFRSMFRMLAHRREFEEAMADELNFHMDQY